MKLVPWQPGFTWRKLGYLGGSSSLAYRDIISLNPGWDVTVEPPLGKVIRIEMGGAGGGTQGIQSSINSIGGRTSKMVAPFDTIAEYVESLSKYSPSSLMNVDQINGWDMDSLAAVTGIQ